MNDDREPPPYVDATAMPRVDPDPNLDPAADFVWPPSLEDLAACSVVPLDADGRDCGLWLIGGFPIAEADPRLRSKRLVDGEPVFPVTIGGFPVRERAPLFAAPPSPLPRPQPPPLPEFAATVEPPPLPTSRSIEPVLEPAAVAAAPIEIPPVVLEPFFPPLIAARTVPEPTAEALFFAPAVAARAPIPQPIASTPIADQLVTPDDQLIASDAFAPPRPAAPEPLDGEPVVTSAEAPTRIDTATIERLFASTGLWGVRRVQEIRRPVEMSTLLREPSGMGRRSRVSVGLLVAASLALVSWSEFRAQRRIQPEVPVAASDPPAALALAKAPAPTAVPAAEPAPEPVPVAPEPIASPVVPDSPAPKVARRERLDDDRDEPLRPLVQRAATPVRWPSRPAVLPSMKNAVAAVRWPSRPAVLPSMPTRPLPAPYAPARVTHIALATPASTSAPVSVPAVATPSPMRAAAPARSAAIDTPVPLETSVRLPSEEDNVRAALTRWRTAYSQLDARAAKGVYPGLDQRALERAFQNLKSQDVRFDHCELKLRDESAQADCIGRAIYVPRIGSQTPITAPRAWRFELKRYDQGWTIASARSS